MKNSNLLPVSPAEEKSSFSAIQWWKSTLMSKSNHQHPNIMLFYLYHQLFMKSIRLKQKKETAQIKRWWKMSDLETIWNFKINTDFIVSKFSNN